MQAVPAAAGYGIIKRQLQVIVAEEPVECRPGLAAPATVTRYAVRLQARGNRSGRFEWLLIEARLMTVFRIKTLRADRNKVAVGIAPLHFQQPLQRFEACGNHAIILSGCAN